jgi:dTMP kinase
MMIAIEGIDAAGKATQSRMLVERLQQLGHGATLLSFPWYESPLGKLIRRLLRNEVTLATAYERADGRLGTSGPATAYEDALALQALLLANKCEASQRVTAALARGDFIVLDRWWLSALVYGSADGLDPEWLRDLHAFLPAPELSLLIDVPPEVARERRPRARDRYEADRGKQEQIRARYLDTWRGTWYPQHDRARYRVIDGVGTLDEVHARVWEAVLPLLATERPDVRI